MVRNLTICNEKSNRDCHDRQLQIQRQGLGNLAPILGKVELLSFTKESTVRRWTALLSQRNRYEGSDKDDDDDGVDDIYIMMQCVCVCNEKSSLPPGSLL